MDYGELVEAGVTGLGRLGMYVDTGMGLVHTLVFFFSVSPYRLLYFFFSLSFLFLRLRLPLSVPGNRERLHLHRTTLTTILELIDPYWMMGFREMACGNTGPTVEESLKDSQSVRVFGT